MTDKKSLDENDRLKEIKEKILCDMIREIPRIENLQGILYTLTKKEADDIISTISDAGYDVSREILCKKYLPRKLRYLGGKGFIELCVREGDYYFLDDGPREFYFIARAGLFFEGYGVDEEFPVEILSEAEANLNKAFFVAIKSLKAEKDYMGLLRLCAHPHIPRESSILAGESAIEFCVIEGYYSTLIDIEREYKYLPKYFRQLAGERVIEASRFAVKRYRDEKYRYGLKSVINDVRLPSYIRESAANTLKKID